MSIKYYFFAHGTSGAKVTMLNLMQLMVTDS